MKAERLVGDVDGSKRHSLARARTLRRRMLAPLSFWAFSRAPRPLVPCYLQYCHTL